MRIIAHGGNGLAGPALGDDIARAAFALTALRGHPQLHLDIVKVEAGPCMAGNLAIRNTVAYANNHDPYLIKVGLKAGLDEALKGIGKL